MPPPRAEGAEPDNTEVPEETVKRESLEAYLAAQALLGNPVEETPSPPNAP
jgi:hypothetical protein